MKTLLLYPSSASPSLRRASILGPISDVTTDLDRDSARTASPLRVHQLAQIPQQTRTGTALQPGRRSVWQVFSIVLPRAAVAHQLPDARHIGVRKLREEPVQAPGDFVDQLARPQLHGYVGRIVPHVGSGRLLQRLRFRTQSIERFVVQIAQQGGEVADLAPMRAVLLDRSR